MARRLNKKEIKFSEGIPNNMDPKRPGSRVDMSQATIDYDKGGIPSNMYSVMTSK